MKDEGRTFSCHASSAEGFTSRDSVFSMPCEQTKKDPDGGR